MQLARNSQDINLDLQCIYIYIYIYIYQSSPQLQKKLLVKRHTVSTRIFMALTNYLQEENYTYGSVNCLRPFLNLPVMAVQSSQLILFLFVEFKLFFNFVRKLTANEYIWRRTGIKCIHTVLTVIIILVQFYLAHFYAWQHNLKHQLKQLYHMKYKVFKAGERVLGCDTM
jgi:hypothetical protein